VKLLLDTHVLVWLVEGVESLAPRHRTRLVETAAEQALTVSAISFWEVAMLERARRLSLTCPVEAWRHDVLATAGLAELPVGGAIAVEAVRLPGTLHADPADRIIVATARLEAATLVTHDRRILEYAEKGHVSALAV